MSQKYEAPKSGRQVFDETIFAVGQDLDPVPFQDNAEFRRFIGLSDEPEGEDDDEVKSEPTSDHEITFAETVGSASELPNSFAVDCLDPSTNLYPSQQACTVEGPQAGWAETHNSSNAIQQEIRASRGQALAVSDPRLTTYDYNGDTKWFDGRLLFITEWLTENDRRHHLFCSRPVDTRPCDTITVTKMSEDQAEAISYFACSSSCLDMLEGMYPNQVIAMSCSLHQSGLPHLVASSASMDRGYEHCHYHERKRPIWQGREVVFPVQQPSVRDTNADLLSTQTEVKSRLGEH